MIRLKGCFARVVRAWTLTLLMVLSQPGWAQRGDLALEVGSRLGRGDVVVTCSVSEDTRYVTGRIHIDQPPDRVWRILVNPFEFEGKIFPRMKQVEVIVDKPEISVMKCSVDICAVLPRISYVVESRYHDGKVDFRRVSGVPREFRGYWQVAPVAGGARSEVTYSLFVDPGIPCPQWIVREAVRVELPKTLTALRERVMNVYSAHVDPEPRSIVAAANAVRCVASEDLSAIEIGHR